MRWFRALAARLARAPEGFVCTLPHGYVVSVWGLTWFVETTPPEPDQPQL